MARFGRVSIGSLSVRSRRGPRQILGETERHAAERHVLGAEPAGSESGDQRSTSTPCQNAIQPSMGLAASIAAG